MPRLPASVLVPPLLLLTLTLTLALAACESRQAPTRTWQPSDHVQPSEVDPARMPADGREPAEPEAGGEERAVSALWNISCASCHGRDGRGQGPGKPPGAQIADFTQPEFQSSRTDAALLQVIKTGRNMMPSFEKQVNEQGITALVAHIRRFGGAAPAPSPAAGVAPSDPAGP